MMTRGSKSELYISCWYKGQRDRNGRGAERRKDNEAHIEALHLRLDPWTHLVFAKFPLVFLNSSTVIFSSSCLPVFSENSAL